MEIYADLVFFINFAMDVFILFLTGKIMGKKIKPLRIGLGGAVLAGLYVAALLFGCGEGITGFFLSIGMIATGIFIAFHPFSAKEFLWLAITAYACAFAVGGCAAAIFYIFNFNGYLTPGAVYSNFSYKILFFAAAASYGVMKLVQRRWRKDSIQKRIFYDLTITLNGKDAEVHGLVDTGNSLVDPISLWPVIIAEHAGIKKILPDKINQLYHAHGEDDLEKVLAVVTESGFSGRIRMIPYNSVGRTNGVLLGFRPDKVVIAVGKDYHFVNNVIIGICNFKLSGDGEYQALINPALIS